MLERALPKTIEIHLDLFQPLSTVNADPAQLHQVIMNLAVNARDAMPSGGRLLLETRNVYLDEEYCRSHIDTVPGNYVALRVSDTGMGMDEKTKLHIFDPFFSTKEISKGTGLGLSIVFGIIKNHGGNIICYSEPGRGTTFSLYLPIISMLEDSVEMEKEGPLPQGKETILLVDDEESVRNLASKILQRFGYSVLSAANGREGLNLFIKEKNRIDLVLLDLIMPEMNGRDCLREILRAAPRTKVIIASGYSADGEIDHALEDGAIASIKKPYLMRELLETVRNVLDES
jgi:CheY-like chemotaxis protein